MNQRKTPLFDTLLSHAKHRVTSFHTPGHKNGYGMDSRFYSYVGPNLFHMDVTVFPEVDSLHDPTGCIREAQELCAEAYGSKQSFFLVNGSTSGNMAMLMSACASGQSVILSRSAHKSLTGGIILSGVWPIWLQPMVDQHLDIIYDAGPAQIEQAIRKYPEARAVFITRPTYNGICSDIQAITDICHAHGKLLLVDEAHGPHLKFHPKLPISALQAGADLVVQSSHKILSALSQGSVLHVNSDRVDIHRVRKVVSMLQTTSPFYPILASIDCARKQMATEGRKLIERLLGWGEEARSRINRLEHVFSLTPQEIQSKGYDLDPTKLTLNVTRTGLSGHDIETLLANEYNVQVDCADLFSLIAIMGMGTRKQDVLQLVEAMEDIDQKYHGHEKNWSLQLPSLSTEMVMMPRDVFLNHSTKYVPLKSSAGHISAQTLTPYPPGIPVLIPGERITEEIRDYLIDLVKKQIRISGQETELLQNIKVVAV